MSDGLTYVYAVVCAAADPELAAVAGIDGSPLRRIAAGDVAAVASTVSEDDFGQAVVDERLTDLAWLGPVARSHVAVVAHCHRRTTTMPLRLATVFRDDASVTAHLQERSASLGRAMARIAGCDEWGVKLLAGRPSAPEPSTATSGAAYLRQRRAALRDEQQGSERAAQDAARVLAELSAAARGAVEHRSADPRPVALTASFLVDRSASAPFRDVLDAVTARHGDALEVTGPWAPYSFADGES